MDPIQTRLRRGWIKLDSSSWFETISAKVRSIWVGRGLLPAGENTEATSIHESFLKIRSLSAVINFADQHAAKIIGITSNQGGSGVTVTAHAIARAYETYGKKALLVKLEPPAEEPEEDQAETDECDVPEADPSSVSIDVPVLRLEPGETREGFAAACGAAAADYDAVIVDLPPVSNADGQPSPELLALGPACDMVFLVMLTGVVTRAELAACLETCRIGRVTIGGLILNDFKMTASGLLAHS